MTSATHMLDLAARLALRGFGRAEPNPLVGAVLVKDARVIGLGHHRRFGGPHAERAAIDDARRRGNNTGGSTLYVTLEPCNHQGKQPPCTRAIVDAGISRVIYAASDPHELARGGAAALRAAGVSAELTAASPFAAAISAPFRHRVRSGLPWTIAKWAQTIDGRVATRTGESKWISSERARARVHHLRARVDAILTGIGTVLADDPALTARNVAGVPRIARRVVADSDLDIPLDSQLVGTAREVPLTVACLEELTTAEISRPRREALETRGVEVLGVPADASGHRLDLASLLRRLASQYHAATVMVEAGPGLLGSLFESDLIDQAVVYVAPMLLGDELAASVAVGRIAESLVAARRFDLWRVKSLGGDVEITYARRA